MSFLFIYIHFVKKRVEQFVLSKITRKMESPKKRSRVMIGGMECICRCPVHDGVEYAHGSAQTQSSHVQFGKNDRVERMYKMASKRRNTTSFIPYIRRLVHSSPATRELSISEQASHDLNELLHNVMVELSTKAGVMCRQVHRKTLQPMDIQAASMLTFPPSIFAEAKEHAHLALSKFNQTTK